VKVKRAARATGRSSSVMLVPLNFPFAQIAYAVPRTPSPTAKGILLACPSGASAFPCRAFMCQPFAGNHGVSLTPFLAM
jgi:hypothetical protein